MSEGEHKHWFTMVTGGMACACGATIPEGLGTVRQRFVQLAEVINREITPEKILRAALAEYGRRMNEINSRAGSPPHT